jgi:predicted secreted acid phosphatase
MRKLILACLLPLIVSCALAHPPRNYHTSDLQIQKYVRSGTYARDIAQQISKAKAFLKTAIAHKKPQQKLALILDIDETALSNLKQLMAIYQLPYDVGDRLPKHAMTQVERLFQDSAIAPTLALYQYAIKHHITVFFITGRYDSDRKGTQNNLKSAGYSTYQALIMRTPLQHHEPASRFKTQARQRIQQLGYTIVLNVGDQLSDLRGGYARHTIKLPNPFYYTP